MSCRACRDFQDSDMTSGFRWKNANVEIRACQKHLAEVFAALRAAPSLAALQKENARLDKERDDQCGHLVTLEAENERLKASGERALTPPVLNTARFVNCYICGVEIDKGKTPATSLNGREWMHRPCIDRAVEVAAATGGRQYAEDHAGIYGHPAQSAHSFKATTDNPVVCQSCGGHIGNHTFEQL